MSATDKAKNKAEEMAGKAKEKFGHATGNPDKENEGKVDQAKANVKDAAEKVKDAFRH
ncbi:CsbD family protein [Nocardia tengchongensis]|uniref:CsbD family protein n=1 Tax=Nocardia tengchongensis TaxID=2055889 RepID=A0ABX8CLK6_9NOCA|nr:CsbD family protein [Nocardia tengchongensis]QVI19793.1 CsbD family protein [Nocardia tengchongensis]